MFKQLFHLFILMVFTGVVSSCSTAKKNSQTAPGLTGLKFINSYEIPFNYTFKNTVVGGLSGIDYNAKGKCFYMISDDRSEKNAARFYTANIFISARGIDSLKFTAVQYLQMADGKLYPGSSTDRYNTPDPESIRYNAKKKNLVLSSEGERIVTAKDTVLVNPTVINMKLNGAYLDSFFLPANMQMAATETGPRRNGVFEGLSYADDYKTLYVSVEEPLYQDGERADVFDNNACIRIIKFDVASRKSKAQFLYKLDPVAYAPTPSNAFKVNGVPEILSLGNDKILVLERSYSTGRIPCTIKLFVADLKNAVDCSTIALPENPACKTIPKKLLLNMDDLGIYTDNIEGITFGPLLPNGHKTLIFIADNNFSPLEKAQLLLFEIVE